MMRCTRIRQTAMPFVCLEILSIEDEKSINLAGTKIYTENILTFFVIFFLVFLQSSFSI